MGQKTYTTEQGSPTSAAIGAGEASGASLMRVLHEPQTDEVLDVRSELRGVRQEVEWRCVDDRWERWSTLEQAWCETTPPDLLLQTARGGDPAPNERFRIVDGVVERVLALDGDG